MDVTYKTNAPSPRTYHTCTTLAHFIKDLKENTCRIEVFSLFLNLLQNAYFITSNGYRRTNKTDPLDFESKNRRAHSSYYAPAVNPSRKYITRNILLKAAFMMISLFIGLLLPWYSLNRELFWSEVNKPNTTRKSSLARTYV